MIVSGFGSRRFETAAAIAGIASDTAPAHGLETAWLIASVICSRLTDMGATPLGEVGAGIKQLVYELAPCFTTIGCDAGPVESLIEIVNVCCYWAWCGHSCSQ